ncbi:unnamed protein product [Zymoseptoria tritici ST99CH_1E4]|uniref:Uncharacterized protein n=1 Tax=Zymoseptoria tritici ST99CH_1E4 TaxID=1276532 RepID=A0A2H1HBY6_ZYMTR|nr:unnamed protein product [Zymoseptoria tritici ST99CH_1E4]
MMGRTHSLVQRLREVEPSSYYKTLSFDLRPARSTQQQQHERLHTHSHKTDECKACIPKKSKREEFEEEQTKISLPKGYNKDNLNSCSLHLVGDGAAYSAAVIEGAFTPSTSGRAHGSRTRNATGISKELALAHERIKNLETGLRGYKIGLDARLDSLAHKQSSRPHRQHRPPTRRDASSPPPPLEDTAFEVQYFLWLSREEKDHCMQLNICFRSRQHRHSGYHGSCPNND